MDFSGFLTRERFYQLKKALGKLIFALFIFHILVQYRARLFLFACFMKKRK
ncbi:hypothetical protein B4119_0956 [Parageobacillus caldoxylosilyticus]|uniref:Uncharacterized protein n=1 Tax=Saccharococcus caldoxylosilyticus TaxID=81408 RepID=A0A150LNF5_9BACL|nr:hypothetical protein B4119_0956 [Parageobacillus caldoxylosilyticus]